MDDKTTSEQYSLYDKLLKKIKEKRNNAIQGNINCIPIPLKRLSKYWYGIEKGKYYLVSGGTKAAKTQITNFLFVINVILYYYYNRDKVKPKIFYFALEETKENITLRFISFLLYQFYNIRVSSKDLLSINKDKPLDENIINILNNTFIKELLNIFEEVIEFYTDVRYNIKIDNIIINYAKNNGTIKRKSKKITYKDDNGNIINKEIMAFDSYIPNDDKEYVIIIIDHVSLLNPERGKTLKQTIDELSTNMVEIKNKYNYIPVIVQQQSVETSDIEAFRLNKIRPTIAGLSDSKYSGRDCNVMFGITNPNAFDLKEYEGYPIRDNLSNYCRFLEIVVNREGESQILVPLYFDGAICNFKELPVPPRDKDTLKLNLELVNLIKQIKTFN